MAFKIGNKYFTASEEGGLIQTTSERDILGRLGTGGSLEASRVAGDLPTVDPSQIRFERRSEIDKYALGGDPGYNIFGPTGHLGRIQNLAQAQALGITPPTQLPQGQIEANPAFQQYLQQTGQQFTGGQFSGSAQVPFPNVQPGAQQQTLATMQQPSQVGQTPPQVTNSFGQVYKDAQGNVFEAGTNRHITLDEFKQRGLNIDHINLGSPSQNLLGQGVVTTSQLPQEQQAQQLGMQGQIQQTDDMVSRIMSQLTPSDRESQLEQQLNQILQSKELGQIDIEQQNIPMQIISSQQNLLERQAQIKIAGLQNELQRLQGNREGQLRTLEFAYRVDENNKDRQIELYKLTQPQNIFTDEQNGIIYMRNPVTGKIYGTELPKYVRQQKYQSGIIGEYEYYVQQEQTSGRQPLSFQEYQNIDANRKRALNITNIGGLTNDQFNRLDKIADNARQDPNIKDFPAVRASFETARSAKETSNSAGDIVLMRMLAKITDPTTGVREEEYRTFQDAIGTLPRYGVKLTSQMLGKGQLTPGGRNSLFDQINSIYNQRKAAYDNSVSIYDTQSQRYGGTIDDVLPVYVAPEIQNQSIEQEKANNYLDSLGITGNEVSSYIKGLGF